MDHRVLFCFTVVFAGFVLASRKQKEDKPNENYYDDYYDYRYDDKVSDKEDVVKTIPNDIITTSTSKPATYEVTEIVVDIPSPTTKIGPVIYNYTTPRPLNNASVSDNNNKNNTENPVISNNNNKPNYGFIDEANYNSDKESAAKAKKSYFSILHIKAEYDDKPNIPLNSGLYNNIYYKPGFKDYILNIKKGIFNGLNRLFNRKHGYDETHEHRTEDDNEAVVHKFFAKSSENFEPVVRHADDENDGMTAMFRHAIVVILCLHAFEVIVLEAAKQNVQLSDSYLPVAMQVIAHLTDQMAFVMHEESEAKPPKPSTKPPTTPKPLDETTPFHQPGYYAPASPPKPSERILQKQLSPQNNQQNLTPQHQPYPTPQNQQQNQHQYATSQVQQQYNYPSQQQLYNFPTQNQQQYYFPSQNQPQYNFPSQYPEQYNILPQNQQTYNFQENQNQNEFSQNQQVFNVSLQDQYLNNEYQRQYNLFQNQQQYNTPQNQQFNVMTFDLPQYNPLQPQSGWNEEPLLSAHHEEVKPLMEPTPNAPQLLPPHFETDVDKISSRSKGFDVHELTEENLQYLSHNVREMIRMAHDPHDERLVDVWEGLRARPLEPAPKGKMSSSNLRLLLLYDLLSREAKRQRLSDYSGFSPDVMKTLVESSSGGAREQLKMALSKMVERKDCAHEYANNRAKEMVMELGKDDSKLSSEIRYLQPLVYKY
ncbi:unnamed protein product [Parnassius apollo]|uniref:(apollo) hypothetical protein n=1 Tax=Parnassius apollo TaxID=110799 RepID=A0A8S3Y300_PARAO|nr:unnamed protein product [Parnassius apollo]